MKTKEALEELSRHIHPNPKARRGLAKALSEFKYDEKASAIAVSLLKNEDSYYVRAELIRSLGKIGIQKYREEIKSHYSEDSHLDVIKSSVIEALAIWARRKTTSYSWRRHSRVKVFQ
ncbi:HEAT repeat domain-containing protein [Metallosphaera hakonensis]|uniref:HEAT repeat domain-containing protein n=1 Tax=Metallosphaera hakonensis TaxID=79601 RepID=UPI0035713C56